MLSNILLLVTLAWSSQAYATGGGNIDGADITVGPSYGTVYAVDPSQTHGYEIIDGTNIDIGTISNSTITATSQDADAHGIWTDDGTIKINEIKNDVTITATGGAANPSDLVPYPYCTATGIGNISGKIAIGTFSGAINVNAGYRYTAEALGIVNWGDDGIKIDNFTGSITAKGNTTFTSFDWANGTGVFSRGNIYINNFSGSITASGGSAVGEAYGVGIYSGKFDYEDGGRIQINNLSGTITATGGTANSNANAYGLKAYGITIGSLSDPLSGISGIVAAYAPDNEYQAYAIYSFGSNDDFVAMCGNGKLIGRVDLNGGDDIFILKDHADISGVSVLDGGNNDQQKIRGPLNENDTLKFDGWSGSLSGVTVTGWETIVLSNGSTVNLGASTDSDLPKSIAFTTLTIDATSTLLAAGSSPGFYTLTGDVTNSGTISLVDHHDTGDRLTINDTDFDTYTGINGSIKFDVNTGSAEADQVTINAKTEGTTRLDLYELGVPTSPATPILLLTTNPPADPGVFTAGEYVYPYGPKLYTFTLTEDEGLYYFTSLEFNRYREEAALLQGVTPFVENLGFESLAGFHDRHAYNHLGCSEKESPKFWARAYGSSYAIGQQGDAATTVSGYSGGTQVGGDFFAAGTGKASQYHIGVYTGTGWQKADVGGIVTSKAGELTQNVYDVGLYASIEHPKCYYLEGVVQSGYHYIDITSPDEPQAIKTKTWSILSSLEGGITLQAGKSLTLEPQFQLIYQHTNDMQISTVIGDATIESHDGLRTRLGLTGTFANLGVSFNPFFELNLIKDFTDDSRVTYAADHSILNSKPETTKLGGAVGIASAKTNKNESVAYYAKVGALYGMDSSKQSYDYTLMAGITKAF